MLFIYCALLVSLIARFEYVARALEGKDFLGWILVDIILLLILQFYVSLYLLNIEKVSNFLHKALSFIAPIFLVAWITRYDLKIIFQDPPIIILWLIGMVVFMTGANASLKALVYKFWLKEKERLGEKVISLAEDHADLIPYHGVLIFFASMPIMAKYYFEIW